MVRAKSMIPPPVTATPPPRSARRLSPVARLLVAVAEALDRGVGWFRLPTPVGLAVLVGLRSRLRSENLFDTGAHPAGPLPTDGSAVDEHLRARTVNGTYNSLDEPRVGSVGCRFGRNVPLKYTYPEDSDRVLEPNPRLISQDLLTRDRFQPATTLNLLAAAWIQFEVHDWLSHGEADTEPWTVLLPDRDPWPAPSMTIPRTPTVPSPESGGPPTYTTDDTHWWDASQIYGSTAKFAAALRTGEKGRLEVDELGLPPLDVEGLLDLSSAAANAWVGLALLHSLFMREHNAICERLTRRYPDMSDQQLYDTARLVNSALIAKIHTIDWTPAIIAHPTTIAAMRANWFGVLGERIARRFGRLSSNEVLCGIPGSAIADHGIPYSLTEEFVAVYRMHPLIPDTFVVRSLIDDSVLAEHPFPDLEVAHIRERLAETSMDALFYSFGRAHPGALTLHNYPGHLQKLARPGHPLMDLATVDILRVRERGVPRYNEFRRQLRLPPAASFEELTDNPGWARELERVYGDVERVDLMVGLYAEPKPPGFGFSDTAFRVFVLMASRRLSGDRFFTTDFRPEIYTEAGMAWVRDNTMRSVLLRHFPTLAPALDGVTNPFAPWHSVDPPQEQERKRPR
ncbi:peroxidase [Nocardia sp. NBC_00565]|uniref:peroxidase family protein n=1 Tax=Nocardia sp. NBC_00565 TaxID=2975993 RepID=UPI002E803DB1|nr:peroxidase family protein [Nocardia sp. NBC_00565]WUC06731.1 peroxidase [Nocardia sp. NBC_00565]